MILNSLSGPIPGGRSMKRDLILQIFNAVAHHIFSIWQGLSKVFYGPYFPKQVPTQKDIDLQFPATILT